MYQQNNEGGGRNKKNRTEKEKANDLRKSIKQKVKNTIHDQKQEMKAETRWDTTWFDYDQTKRKQEKITGKKTELLTYSQACFLLKKIDLSQYLFHNDASTGLRLDFLYDYNNNEIRIERRNIEKLQKRLKA